MILRARCVLSPEAAPLENGAVVVRGERIEDIGNWSDIRAHHTGEVVDLGDSILLPGLINAHCHLDYTSLRGAIPQQNSFTDWIRAINAKKAAMREEDYLRSIRAGIDEAARFGTTTIANLEAFPQLIGKVADESMRIRWLIEMIDVRGAVAPAELLSLTAAREQSGLAPHAPYTASAALYAAAASLTRERGLVATTHLAESREEMLMFREGSGPLFDFMRAIGRDMSDCGRQTPVARMLERGVLDEHWLVAHLNEITTDDFAHLARAPRFHIVHCPRSHGFFDHSPFQFAKLRELGFNICLGTDSLASNDNLSLFAEMRTFRRAHPTMEARDVFALVTTNAAAALHEAQSLGRIARGGCADLIALPFAGDTGDALESVLEFDADVPWRMTGGRISASR